MPLLSPKNRPETSYHLAYERLDAGGWGKSQGLETGTRYPENLKIPAPNKKRSGALPLKSALWQPSPRTACYGYDCIVDGAGGKRDFGNLGSHRGNVARLSRTTYLS